MAAGFKTEIDTPRTRCRLTFIRKTHRVHTTYALAATTTDMRSRMSPTCRTFRSGPRSTTRSSTLSSPRRATNWCRADYSQIELRLLAEIADIPVLKQAFRDGLDIHAMTASEMFGVPVKDMPAKMRAAPRRSTRIIYGISAFGLANQLGIAREEAAAYIERYLERCRASAPIWMKPANSAARMAMSVSVRPEIINPRSRPQRFGSSLMSAVPSTRACRACRRHHPPSHDPDGDALAEKKLSAQMCCKYITSWLRGTRRGIRRHPAGRATHHARRAVPGGPAFGATTCRPRSGQLGRGALRGIVIGNSSAINPVSLPCHA